jgi:hypothetical protein
MKRGLLAIQFWPGDAAKAMTLARFMADLEPVKRNDIDFLFVARHDAVHDKDSIKYVSRKFDVRTITLKARAQGHPWACWVLWHSTLTWFFQMTQARKIPNYQWIFPFEADCTPIRRTWINDCAEEFDRFRQQGNCIVGAETLHYNWHINGNLMVANDTDFLKWLVQKVGIGGVQPRDAWDIALAPRFAQWGCGGSNRILNVCGKRGCTANEFDQWLTEGRAFIHGEKTGEVYARAGLHLLNRPSDKLFSPPTFTNLL